MINDARTCSPKTCRCAISVGNILEARMSVVLINYRHIIFLIMRHSHDPPDSTGVARRPGNAGTCDGAKWG